MKNCNYKKHFTFLLNVVTIITYDNKKNESNKEKHGLNLSDAKDLDWNSVLSKPDTRRDYRELREIGYGVMGDRLYCVVFVQRGQSYHVISFRKANRREVKEYESQT